MKTDEQQDIKKARVDHPPVAPSVPCMVSIDNAKFQCPVCTHPLKPPIFQCAAAGHLACGACHGQLADKDRCYKCAHAGGYRRCLPAEAVVRSIKTSCPYLFYGCYPMMTLYEMEDHWPKCPHAPCRCSEPGCAFVGSPARLSCHLRSTHFWPVISIDYGKACRLQLPASKPRCVLVATGDGRVFVVSVAAHRRGVLLVCLRANASAAGPHYTCKMSATGSAAAASGKVPNVSVEMEVPSSSVAGEAAGMDTEATVAAALVVPRKMLHGSSKELHLSVRIDKVQT